MTKSGTMLGLVPTLNVQCNNHESQACPYANTVEKHLGLKVFIRRTRLEVSHRLLFALPDVYNFITVPSRVERHDE